MSCHRQNAIAASAVQLHYMPQTHRMGEHVGHMPMGDSPTGHVIPLPLRYSNTLQLLPADESAGIAPGAVAAGAA